MIPGSKTILLISPDTFSYSKFIAEELFAQGFKVVHWNSRLSESSIYKVLLRVIPGVVKKYSEYFYRKRIAKENIENVQYVLVIKGDGLNANVIKNLQEKYSNAKFALYLWDSIRNLNGVKKLALHFKFVATFDPDDAVLMKWRYRPLFASLRAAEEAGNNKQCYKYDISFIGTNHSDRLKILDLIINKYGSKYRIFIYLYFQRWWILIFKKLTSWSLFFCKDKYLRSQPIDYMDCLDVIQNSKAILDIEHPNQRGLTMRTIEVLISGKKLITTNTSIKSCDLYHPSRVELIDRKNPFIRSEFFLQEFLSIDSNVINRYSISKWFSDIFTI